MRRNALGYEKHASVAVGTGYMIGKLIGVASKAFVFTVVAVWTARLMGVDI